MQAPRSEPGPGGSRRVPMEEVMRIFVRKPGFLLNRIDQIVNARYAALREGRETLAQAEVLLAVAAGEAAGIDQVWVARACGIDTSTTAIILDNLAQAGLIRRAQDQRDRRRSLPALTAAGAEQLPAVRAAFAALQGDLLPGSGGGMDLLHRLVLANEGSAPRWDMASSPLGEAPSLLLRRALQISHALFSACVAPLSITLRQFSALLILHFHPGLGQLDFARAYGLDPSTCAIVLKKLVSRGLLEAVRCADDRRKTRYSTTAEGAEQAASIQGSAERSEQMMLALLTGEERRQLLALLQDIVQRLSPQLRFPGCLPFDDRECRRALD